MCFSECRQLCRKGALNEAKILSTSIDNLLRDKYLFPTSHDRSSQKHHLYETLQRSHRQLRSDIRQTHYMLWNDGIDRTTKNQLIINFDSLDRLFQCTFNDREEKELIENHLRTFATYSFQVLLEVLLEKNMKLTIEEETTMIAIRLEENEESEEIDLARFNQTLNYLKQFFHVLNTHVLSRVMIVQTSADK